jgi:cellulose synthase/poly-beta-1,6-N-acetylglucosamine synthase-like glycosyltransferase
MALQLSSTEDFMAFKPALDTTMVVVIPACGEHEYLLNCLESLQRIEHREGSILIYVIVNHGYLNSAGIMESNAKCVEILRDFPGLTNQKYFLFSYPTQGINGVGAARKYGMNQAADWFARLNRDGIIVCLDADCTVAGNYFFAIREAFEKHPKMWAASIQFEHPLDSEAIILYELHLRYFVDAQRRIGLPFAFQTVGSAMAVRSKAYTSLGGMNRKQAGEDFYFLQKFISVERCFEINHTRVFPSSRASNRVPFGTGKAINDITRNSGLTTYHPRHFDYIHDFIGEVFRSYPEFSGMNIRPELLEWLQMQKYESLLHEMVLHTASFASFQKRFFQWFNAFRLMKCLHHLRECAYADIPVAEAANLHLIKHIDQNISKPLEQLLILRKIAENSR